MLGVTVDHWPSVGTARKLISSGGVIYCSFLTSFVDQGWRSLRQFPLFVNFSRFISFKSIVLSITCYTLISHLVGVAAVDLRCQLPNMAILVITLPTDILKPNGARPSVYSVWTTNFICCLLYLPLLLMTASTSGWPTDWSLMTLNTFRWRDDIIHNRLDVRNNK